MANSRTPLREALRRLDACDLAAVEELLPLCACGGQLNIVDENENLAIWLACCACEYAAPVSDDHALLAAIQQH